MNNFKEQILITILTIGGSETGILKYIFLDSEKSSIKIKFNV